MEMDPQDQLATESMVKLTDITRGLYHAASSTYSMLGNQYVTLLQQYFEETSDGNYVPKSVVVELPDETVVNLPLISLVTPKGLMLDKVNFDFSVVMESAGLVDATTDLDDLDLTRSSFKVEMAPRSADAGEEGKQRKTGVVDVKMEFKVNEPPEGIMRLLDKFASFVTPVKPAVVNTNYVPLLSARFFFIAQALGDAQNKTLAEVITVFNPDYAAERIHERGEAIKKWEDELLAKSVAIDRAKAAFAPTFKELFQYARIAFKGTAHFDKLNLSQKLSDKAREWTEQAMRFYETLLREDETAFIFGKFKNPEWSGDDFKNTWKQGLEKIKEVKQLLQDYDDQKNIPEFDEAQEWLEKFAAVAKILLKDKPEQLAKLFPDTEFLNK